jgi:hypothetical protein
MLTKFYTTLPSYLLGIFFILAFVNVQAQGSEMEPNNTRAQANILLLNGNISGAINPAGDVDWFQVTTTSDGQLNITFDNTGNPDIKVVTLFDNDGVTQLNTSNVGDGVGGINTNGLASGTYYIKINGNVGNETGTYKLSDTLIVPARANDIEPNDNITQAERLPLNDSATGHLGYYYNNRRDTTDWYKVTTTADGQLDIMFDNTGNPDIKSVILYDTTGAPQLNSGNIGNGIGGFNTNGLAPGTYYIKITGTVSSDFGPYKISDSLEVAKKTNDKEPNNNFSQADMLAINDSVTGHLGYYYNNMRDTSDWYKLDLTARGKLKILLDNSGNPDIKSLNLYDASGTNLVTRVGVGNGLGGFQTDTLATGIYYIQIIGTNPNDFGPYSLMDTLYSALPVTFINFDGKISGTAALLSWSTATEENNKGFDVERSQDGQNFLSIGFVAGVGTSSMVNNYTFSDEKVANGSNYYRLRQEDIDDNYSYSSIIRLDYSKFNWFISGNPLTSNSWIQLQLDKETNVAIRVFSANGDVINIVNKGRLSPGNYSLPLELDNKSKGVYIVQLITDNATYAKTIVK